MVKTKKELLLRIIEAEALLINMGKDLSPARFELIMNIMHTDTRKFLDLSSNLTEQTTKYQ